MRKNRLLSLLLAAVMTAAAALTLSSCKDSEESADYALKYNVSGTWYAEYDAEGVVGGGQMQYSRLLTACKFNDDGTGTWYKFMLTNDSGEPIALDGGAGHGDFTYSVGADGKIACKLTWNQAPAYYPKTLALTAGDGIITGADGEIVYSMKPTPDAITSWIAHWDNKLNGGGNVAMDSFNPNDADFNHATWRQQEGIYIYDATGPKIISHNGSQYRFSIAELPWYSKATSSNLPMNFCNDITPENGWDLVMNYCGDTSETNRNFFALYNKWTGVLRFFTYVPKGFESGNDHLWEVIINGQTGLRQGLPYGLPIDKTVTNPSAIGMDISGSSRFISPWVATRSTDGLVTPRAGWWAFDVDMSQYQPNLDMSGDMIRLQMLSWKKEHGTFFSSLEAGLNGSISANIKTELTKNASSLSSTNESMQIAYSAIGAVGAGATGNIGQTFSMLGSMTDHAFTMAGKNKSTTTFNGSINMTMKGSISTSGVLESSVAVTGVSSPTISLMEFDTKNTQLGRGVWNLKTSPVVWLTNASVGMSLYDFWRNYNKDMVTEGNKSRYFPRSGLFYFFDPSSVEVELNPDLFPSSQVEWTQVEAYCVNRAENGVRGTDNYRKAYGLSSRTTEFRFFPPSISKPDGNWVETLDDVAPVFDFCYYSDDKMGLSYPAIISAEKRQAYHPVYGNYNFYDGVIGRGNAGGVGIEPMVLADDDCDEGWRRVPALEVMVILKVKVRSMDNPLVYVRHYLPEVKPLEIAEPAEDLSKMNPVWQNIKARQPKGTGINRQSPAYDYEMQRIGKVLNFINPDFKAN